MNKKETVLIKVIDEINAIVVGMKPGDYKFLSDKYSKFVKNYFFMKKYKLGIWDGKVKFFSNAGKTYVKILPEIIKEIYKLGYKIKIEDKRKPLLVDIPKIDKYYFENYGIELADHQVDAVNAAIESNEGIILAATNAGKTFIAAALANLYNSYLGNKVIVIVPNQDLISQTIEEFEVFDLDVGEYSGSRKDINHEIVISTWQSLQNNPSILGMFGVILVDECHGVKGDVLRKLLNEDAPHIPIKIGMTGTLPDDEVDALNVKVSLGEVIYEITSKYLIDIGWSARPTIYTWRTDFYFHKEYKEFLKTTKEKISYTKFFNSYFPDYTSEKKFLNTNPDRIEKISKVINSRKGNTLIMVNSRKVGIKYQEKVKNSIFIDGDDKKEFRKKIYALFKEHDNIAVIATPKLVSTGLSIKRIFNMYFIDIGKAYITTIQAIGRGLRKAKDKKEIHIFDIYSNLYYSKAHYRDRIKFYKKHEYEYKDFKETK